MPPRAVRELGNLSWLMPPAHVGQAGPRERLLAKSLLVMGMVVMGEAGGVHTSFLTCSGAPVSFRSSAWWDGCCRCSSITIKPWKMQERRKSYWRWGGDRSQTCWHLEAAEIHGEVFHLSCSGPPVSPVSPGSTWQRREARDRTELCGLLLLVIRGSRGLTLKGNC